MALLVDRDDKDDETVAKMNEVKEYAATNLERWERLEKEKEKLVEVKRKL